MILPIKTHPNSILRQKSTKVKKVSSDIRNLIDDMIETLKKADGVGLAAPQINKSIRLVIVNTKNGNLAMVNPKITKKSLRKNIDEEGCLSLPGVFGKVRRYSKVVVKAKNKNFEDIEIVGKGMLARILQHEIDHLNGVLFIDRAIKITKGKELISEKLD